MNTFVKVSGFALILLIIHELTHVLLFILFGHEIYNVVLFPVLMDTDTQFIVIEMYASSVGYFKWIPNDFIQLIGVGIAQLLCIYIFRNHFTETELYMWIFISLLYLDGDFLNWVWSWKTR